MKCLVVEFSIWGLLINKDLCALPLPSLKLSAQITLEEFRSIKPYSDKILTTQVDEYKRKCNLRTVFVKILKRLSLSLSAYLCIHFY